MVPTDDTAYYVAEGTSGPIASAVTVALVGLIGFFLTILVAFDLFRRAKGRARAAKAARLDAETQQLPSTGSAVVRGVVETDDARPAVVVRIVQEGSEYPGSAGWKHTWTEVERLVRARPFVLRHASGTRVRVVPGDGVLLVGSPLRLEPSAIDEHRAPSDPPPRRARVAQLAKGQNVYVVGTLARASSSADRTTGELHELRPPSRGPMLISTEPLEQRYIQRATLHLVWGSMCLVAFLFTNGGLFGSYWLELVAGTQVTAAATRARAWTKPGKNNNPVAHFGVDAHATVEGEDLQFRVETSHPFYLFADSQLAKHRRVELPVVVFPPFPTINSVGTWPTLAPGSTPICWFLLVAVAALYLAHARSTRAWYDRAKVVDAGSGRLGSPDSLA